MKIALITDAWLPQVNGVVRTLGEVQRELLAGGHDFLVFHPGQHHTLPCPLYPEINLSILPGRVLGKILHAERPDAIHIATEGPLGLAARNYCRRHDLPFTTSYHTKFPEYLRAIAHVPAPLTYRVVRWFHSGATRTLVPTPSMKVELDQRGFRNIHVWTRGVDTTLFRPRDKSLLDLPRPIFCYVGRVSTEKNIEAFLRADLPGTKLVIGDGPAMSLLRRRYPDATFTGYKHGEALARHLAACDVFVFPSRTDTFGVVMLEAMACGLPVAAYPVTGPIDIIQPGTVGALDEDLGRAARAALEIHPDDCRAYALGFSWARCAELFLENLEPITRAPRQRHAS